MTGTDAIAEPTVAPATAERHPSRAVLLNSREVPLGGVRGMSVHRALPQRDLPLIGAWCFLDRFGPQRTTMRVQPHPHTGLQTVTWPFAGAIRHRDAIGSDVVLARGELNLMTSGEGIAHSEYSVGEEAVELDALQLWVALPETRRHGPPAFERHVDLPVVEVPAASGESAYAVVVMGTFAGVTSPATVHTPIVGAEVRIPAGAEVRLPLATAWEHGIVGIDGELAVRTDAGTLAVQTDETRMPMPLDATASDSIVVAPEQLLFLGAQRDNVIVQSAGGATVFLLGGAPFEDDIVMWWNFVARSHEEIVDARDAWEASSSRFGHVVGHGDERIPAPPLPHVRLTPRRRR
jgi:redox-sensitive bicupin YhaK (pirin superfamily)